MDALLQTTTFPRGDLCAKKQFQPHQLLSALERVFDFLAVLAAVALAHALYRFFDAAKRPFSSQAMGIAAAAYAGLFIMLLDRHGEYRPCMSLLWVRETERLL